MYSDSRLMRGDLPPRTSELIFERPALRQSQTEPISDSRDLAIQANPLSLLGLPILIRKTIQQVVRGLCKLVPKVDHNC